MNALNKEQMKIMLIKAAESILENEQMLCKLDSYVGDGDHGVTVSRGFTAVRQALTENPPETIGGILELTGDTLSETMGGAIGPIFGSVFSAMGTQAGNIETVNTAAMSAMLASGLEEVMLIGGAKPGDRTLVDALDPAVKALKKAAETGASLPESMKSAAQAAKEGVLATKDMVAKRGRAKFLQEKSLGYQDAGATSMQLILEAMADCCGE